MKFRVLRGSSSKRVTKNFNLSKFDQNESNFQVMKKKSISNLARERIMQKKNRDQT